jgi:isopentenyl phosphate kinase
LERQLLLIKLGGSVITHKEEAFSPNLSNLYKIAKVLSDFWKETKTKMCIVHGGGSYAHAVATRYATPSTFYSKNKLGISLVTWSVRKLNDRVIESFVDYNIPVFPLQTSAMVSIYDSKLRINQQIIETLVSSGWIPVLHGDVLPDTREPRIVSGERVMELLCGIFDVKKIIVCTITNGVLLNLEKPEEGVIKLINPENIQSVSQKLQDSLAIDVTGGMKDKVRVLYDIATKHGVPSQIINGTNPLTLRDCLRDKHVVGTWITGDKND